MILKISLTIFVLIMTCCLLGICTIGNEGIYKILRTVALTLMFALVFLIIFAIWTQI